MEHQRGFISRAQPGGVGSISEGFALNKGRFWETQRHTHSLVGHGGGDEESEDGELHEMSFGCFWMLLVRSPQLKAKM